MQARALVRGAQQKMPGKIDAVDVHARPPRDLEIDDREADRDAGAAVEDFVEEAVPRVVVPVAISGEALIVVQVFVQHLDGVLAAGPGLGTRAAASSPIRSMASR